MLAEGIDELKQDVSRLEGKVDAIRDAMTGGPEKHRVDLQAVAIEGEHGSRVRRWLVTSTVAGEAVHATLTGAVAFDLPRGGPALVHDVAGFIRATEPAVGVHDITLELPRTLRGVDVFLFSVEFVQGTTRSVGALLVHKNAEDNLASQ